MIPASFDYVRPGSVAEAVSALGSAGEDAKVIAGGQSLIPVLRLRMAYPSTLVDVGRWSSLPAATGWPEPVRSEGFCLTCHAGGRRFASRRVRRDV